MRSDHRLRALIGPVYAGRKSAAFYDILRRAVRFPQQHSWRWVVVRQRRDELEGETLRTIQHWMEDGAYDEKTRRWGYRYDLGDDADRRLTIEFFAMEDAVDRRRLPNLECSAVWLDDARKLGAPLCDVRQ